VDEPIMSVGLLVGLAIMFVVAVIAYAYFGVE
jgi:hypothetical protein